MDVLSLPPLGRAPVWARPAVAATHRAPFVLLVVAAAVREARPLVLLVIVAGLGAALLADRLRLSGADRSALAWAAAMPVGLVLAWGMLPTPAVLPGLGSCADPLSPPATWRALEALVILAVTAALIPVGGWEPLLLRRPRSRSVIAIAALAPLAAIPAVVLGPGAAGPFFGEVNVALPLGAFVPAIMLAMSNAALEEVAYRGALLGWGGRAIGPGAALVAQAVVFGFAHWGPDMQEGAPVILAGMTAAGLVAGFVARRTGSLLLPFAVHAAVDIPLYHALACRLG